MGIARTGEGWDYSMALMASRTLGKLDDFAREVFVRRNRKYSGGNPSLSVACSLLLLPLSLGADRRAIVGSFGSIAGSSSAPLRRSCCWCCCLCAGPNRPSH